MDMNTLNGKVGWIIAGVVVVLALAAYAVYEGGQPAVPMNDMATTTEATTTDAAAPVVKHTQPAKAAVTPAPAPAPATSTPAAPTTASDGTILYGAPSAVTIPVGKTALEKNVGLRVTVKKIETQQKTPVNQPEPTVVTLGINTGICADGQCSSREDTEQNVMMSTGQSIVFGGYTIAIKGLNVDSATVSVSKAP
jgi:hypothetical protein